MATENPQTEWRFSYRKITWNYGQVSIAMFDYRMVQGLGNVSLWGFGRIFHMEDKFILTLDALW